MFEISKPEDAEPFAWSDDFWRLAKLDPPTAPVTADDDICSLFKKFDLKDYVVDETRAFHLSEEPRSLFGKSPFELPFVAIPRIPSLSPSPTLLHEEQAVEKESVSSAVADASDVWLNPSTTEPPEKPTFLTWDGFLGLDTSELTNPYLTENTPDAFDAALEDHLNDISSPEAAGSVIRTDVFCYCLLYLAVGRNSILFQFNESKFDFDITKGNIRVTGTTVGTCKGIISSFMKCGRDVRILQRFSDSVYSSSESQNPAMVALAECCASVVGAVYRRLAIPFRSVVSVIHLLDSLGQPALVLDCMVRIIEKLVDIKNTSDLLSKLFDLVQQFEHRTNWLRPLLLRVLARLCEPWLEKISTYIGLVQSHSVETVLDDDFFVILEDKDEEDEDAEPIMGVDWDRVPSFLTPESVQTIFVTGMALELLKKFHPKHPVSRAVGPVAVPKLLWKFSWEDLELLQANATKYEKSVTATVKAYSEMSHDSKSILPHASSEPPSTGGPFDVFSKSKEEVAAALSSSIAEMNQPPSYSSFPSVAAATVVGENGENLQDMVFQMISEEIPELSAAEYAPPLSITPMLSLSSILAVQARLVNKATTKMMFEEHQLRQHFTVLRRFQLLGDGVFISRLSNALFDEEIDSSDRRTGAAFSGSSMGLKLGSRDTWPPASSELRLALMGILSECYHDDGKGTSHHHRQEKDIPGGLSFTVRDMSEEELQVCMDADSITALDFLRIQYKPPAPIDTVINPRALYKYDRLFKLLLRLTRMLFVVNNMFKDLGSRHSPSAKDGRLSNKFWVEAHHFVSNVSQYFFETGVSVTWGKFEGKMEEIESQAKLSDGDCEGLGAVMDYHERALDQMLFATLSRKRQQPVMKLLEDIFSSILTFARYVKDIRSGIAAVVEKYDQGFLDELHQKFRKKVAIFVNVCRGLSEKRGYGNARSSSKAEFESKEADVLYRSSDSEEGGMLGQLLVKLEMTGYYTNVRGGAASK